MVPMRSQRVPARSWNSRRATILPGGSPVGTAEEALYIACGLYLGDPTAWHTE